jgi:transcriptional regulator with XRE-family HTH domain
VSYHFSDIGDRLRAARIQQGLSQDALAAKIGVTQATVSRAEGSGDIRLATLVEIARALDLEPTVIPRRLLPAMQALFGDGAPDHGNDDGRFTAWDGDEPYTEADDDATPLVSIPRRRARRSKRSS